MVIMLWLHPNIPTLKPIIPTPQYSDTLQFTILTPQYSDNYITTFVYRHACIFYVYINHVNSLITSKLTNPNPNTNMIPNLNLTNP